MIRNFVTTEEITEENSHGGHGTIEIQDMFPHEGLKGAWDFVLQVTMSPNSSMGLHEHGDNE
jgi:hypothetical protein